MKDRQPTKILANGAIRYGVYNADGTLNHYEYLKREDAPTVEGTPLNKANLLSDATAAKLWPNASARPEEPTVSKALAELKKGTAKIGDILMTARAKPSDAWLPCGGQDITQTEYPELFSLLRSKAGNADWTTQDVTGIDADTKFLHYVNGKWFAFRQGSVDSYSGGESGPLYVYVSEDTHTWTKHTVHYGPVYGSSVGTTILRSITMCYHPIKNAYYLATNWTVTSSSGSSIASYNYWLSADFTQLTQINAASGLDSMPTNSTEGSKRSIWVRPDGSMWNCAITYYRTGSPTTTANPLRYSVYGGASVSTDYGVTWPGVTSNSTLSGADYDADSDQFLFMYGRSAYVGQRLGDLDTATKVGELPTSIMPAASNTSGYISYVCAKTNTIVVVWGDTRMSYAYSTDRGATWQSGPTEIVGGSNARWSALQTEYAYNYVNGLLIFYVETYTGSIYDSWTLSMSDPSDQAYRTEGVNGDAISDAGIAMDAPKLRTQADGTTGGYVTIRDYNLLVKALPTVIPDSRSHAYIKALEE